MCRRLRQSRVPREVRLVEGTSRLRREQPHQPLEIHEAAHVAQLPQVTLQIGLHIAREPQLARPRLLRPQGVRSLFLTGVSTDTCVESTARDGYFRDYYVTLVADCCGALSEEDHRGALARADRDFATVATSAEIIQAWERAALIGVYARPPQVARSSDGPLHRGR